jgi:hypothetical protein
VDLHDTVKCIVPSQYTLLAIFVTPVQLRPNARNGLLNLQLSKSHTSMHHSRQDYSGWVISPSQRPLPDNKQHHHQTNVHTYSGIRTRNLIKRTAAEPRLGRAATGTGRLIMSDAVPLRTVFLYIGRAHRYPQNTPFYVFFQQIYVMNFLNMLHTLRPFLFKMPFIS